MSNPEEEMKRLAEEEYRKPAQALSRATDRMNDGEPASASLDEGRSLFEIAYAAFNWAMVLGIVIIGLVALGDCTGVAPL